MPLTQFQLHKTLHTILYLNTNIYQEVTCFPFPNTTIHVTLIHQVTQTHSSHVQTLIAHVNVYSFGAC